MPGGDGGTAGGVIIILIADGSMDGVILIGQEDIAHEEL